MLPRLPHDPPEKLEIAIIALWRAWHMQALLGQASRAKNSLEATKRIDPLYNQAWMELSAALKDLKLWQALGSTEV
jgi:hypothetical protein